MTSPAFAKQWPNDPSLISRPVEQREADQRRPREQRPRLRPLGHREHPATSERGRPADLADPQDRTQARTGSTNCPGHRSDSGNPGDDHHSLVRDRRDTGHNLPTSATTSTTSSTTSSAAARSSNHHRREPDHQKPSDQGRSCPRLDQWTEDHLPSHRV